MSRLSISVILLAGFAMLWIASSQWGIGYDPDSIIYQDVAENWMAGHGIARYDFATGQRYPMTNFPPLYPIVLGLLSPLVGSMSESARILNTILWSAICLMVYLLIRRGLSSYKIAWFFATLLMSNLLVLQVFGTSWSEPLFLWLSLTGLWFVHSYLMGGKWRYLIMASLFFASAILTRYAGVTLFVAFGIILFTSSDESWRKRIQATFLLGFVSMSPLLIWLLRNMRVRGDIANRDVGFTWIGLPQLESTIQTFGEWLIPIRDLSTSLLLLMVMSILLGWTLLQIRQLDSSTDIGIRMMRWWIVIYILFIVASFMLLDPRIPFNYRILLPAYVGLIILLGRWLAIHWSSLSKLIRISWLIVGLTLILTNWILSANWVSLIHQTGQQYSSRQFQESAIIHNLRKNPTQALLYTNNNFLFHHLTDQPAHLLPSANTNDLSQWMDTLPPDEDILIVFFNVLSQREWQSTEQLEARLPVSPLQQSDIVAIYELELPLNPDE